MNNDRLRLAMDFLQEAVYQSRARQAAGVALAGGDLNTPSTPSNCGLGEKAALALELSAKGRELFVELWPSGLEAVELDIARDVMESWITLQDALDRKRNHFLRDFRQGHGYDRRVYSPEEARAFETGIERVNAEVEKGLESAARKLLGPLETSPCEA